MTDQTPALAIDDRDGVRVMRMNRPPVNALGPEMLGALADEVRRAPDSGARALVLTGGDRVFTGGLDINWLVGLDRAGLTDALERFFDTMQAFAEAPVPVVAAIRGHSPAGGAVLSLLCDRRIMSAEGGTIGLNEVRIGIPLPAIVVALAVRAVGPRRAETLCVGGEMLGPADALEVGVVDELVPADEVVNRAVAWCNTILEAPQLALGRTRMLCRSDLAELVRRHRDDDVGRLSEVWSSPEVRGPLAAVLEGLKRG